VYQFVNDLGCSCATASSSDEDSGEDECALVQKKTGRDSTRKPPPYVEKPKKEKLKSTKTTTSSSDEEETDGSGEDEIAVVQKKTGLKSFPVLSERIERGRQKERFQRCKCSFQKRGQFFQRRRRISLPGFRQLYRGFYCWHQPEEKIVLFGELYKVQQTG
jgi:hypothetical protein